MRVSTPVPIPLSSTSNAGPAAASRAVMIIVVALVLVVDLMLLIHRALMHAVSPYDEGYHLSYVEYASQWSLPRVGDPMRSWAQQAYSCHPTFPFGWVTSVPCGQSGELALYPEGGTNTAAIWPPVYYFLAAQVVRLVTATTSMEPLVGARFASCLLWASGSALLAYLVIRQSGSVILGGAVGIVATANPAAWAIGSYVTPHSAALLIGGALVAFHLRLAGPRQRPWWSFGVLGLVGVLAALTLPHSIVAVAAIGVALLLSAAHRRPRSRRIIGAAVALVVGNLATTLAWTWLVSARTVGSTAAQPTTPPEGVLAAVRDNWDLFLHRFFTEVALTTPLETQSARLFGYVLLGVLGYWLLAGRMPIQRTIAFGVVLVAPLAAIAMALQLPFGVPARYGASLLPLMLFLFALRRRPVWLSTALAALAAFLIVVTWQSTDSYLFMAG